MLDRVHNETIMRWAGVPSIEAILREQRLRWFGHVARMNAREWPRVMVNALVDGKRKRGRPKLRWFEDVVKYDLRELHLPDEMQNAIRAAGHRLQWRKAIRLKWHAAPTRP